MRYRPPKTALMRSFSFMDTSNQPPPRKRDPARELVERYMPEATEEKKLEACESVRAFARLALRVHKRMARERGDTEDDQANEYRLIDV